MPSTPKGIRSWLRGVPREPRTRIAPTPSGFLHRGNAYSFLLTWLLAKAHNGTVHLRIDDLDQARRREEYLDDIFESLAWLGISSDTGPADTRDFLRNHSQSLRTPSYNQLIQFLIDARFCFACRCTRSQLPPGRYPGTCEHLGLPLDEPGTALRLRVPHDAVIRHLEIAGDESKDPVMTEFALGEQVGSFVIRKRDGTAAYQIASVCDDDTMRMNFIVRGKDLAPSTAMQQFIALHAGLSQFQNAVFLHHDLVLSDGEKLSKSAGASSLREIRRAESPAELLREFQEWIGVSSRHTVVSELLQEFRREK